MDIVFTLWMLLLAVVWFVAATVHALPLVPGQLSSFEVRRRAMAGDAEAKHQLQRSSVLPRLQALRAIIVLALVVAFTALAIHVLGWMVGVLLAILAGAHIERLARFRPLIRLSTRFYGPREATIVERLGRWRWLDWFRPAAVPETFRIYSKAELLHLLDASPGVLSHQERVSMTGLLTMGEKQVADIMTPRTMIEGVSVDEGVGPLVIDQLHKTGHSRFPVYDKDIDHVVGMLYLHDIIELRSGHTSVREAMQPRVYYIREDQSLEHALHGFLRTHHHLFIVVNDYRETVGVLSLEDVMEAMMGRTIVDEFDQFDDLRQVAAHNPKKNNQPKGRKEV